MTGQPALAGGGRRRGAEKGPDTRARILATARELFLRHGYAGASTAAIGKALGISAPALYWHFPSKEAILFALLEERLAEFVTTVDSTDPDPQQRLSELVRTYALFQLSREHDVAGYTSLVTVARAAHVLTPEHRARLDTLQRTIYERIRTALVDGDSAGVFALADPTATAFAVIAMCEHVQEWARPDGRLDAEALAGTCVELARRMAGARQG